MPLQDIKDVSNPLKRKHKSLQLTFNEEDEIINPGNSFTLWEISILKSLCWLEKTSMFFSNFAFE